MTAFKTILAGGVAVAALAGAAPAAAQSYPGYGYGYGGGGGVIGQVINSVIGGGYGQSGYNNGYANGYGQSGYNNGYNNSYGQNPYARYGSRGQYAINQCMGAVQQRLTGGYGNNAYGGGYGGYTGYQQQSGARVLGVSGIERRSNGGLSIRGVANSGRNAAYGYGNGYNGQGQVDLTFKCRTDARGYVLNVDIRQATRVNGYNNQGYTPYNNDYSQYGYRRY